MNWLDYSWMEANRESRKQAPLAEAAAEPGSKKSPELQAGDMWRWQLNRLGPDLALGNPLFFCCPPTIYPVVPRLFLGQRKKSYQEKKGPKALVQWTLKTLIRRDTGSQCSELHCSQQLE